MIRSMIVFYYRSYSVYQICTITPTSVKCRVLTTETLNNHL